MAPANAPETLRKALAMGADERRPRHRPGARGLVRGLDRAASSRPRSQDLEFDLVLAGVDTSDGVGGVVPGGDRGPARAAVPVLRRADRARRGGRDRPRPPHQRRPATTSSRRRCPRSSSAPRRSASRATRRSRGSWPRAPRRSRRAALADLGVDPATVGAVAAATSRVVGQPGTRGRAARPRSSAANRPRRPRRSSTFLAERRLI